MPPRSRAAARTQVSHGRSRIARGRGRPPSGTPPHAGRCSCRISPPGYRPGARSYPSTPASQHRPVLSRPPGKKRKGWGRGGGGARLPRPALVLPLRVSVDHPHALLQPGKRGARGDRFDGALRLARLVAQREVAIVGADRREFPHNLLVERFRRPVRQECAVRMGAACLLRVGRAGRPGVRPRLARGVEHARREVGAGTLAQHLRDVGLALIPARGGTHQQAQLASLGARQLGRALTCSGNPGHGPGRTFRRRGRTRRG